MEEQILEFVVSKIGPIGILIASALGLLMVVGQGIVAITPSKDDDEWLEKKKKHKIWGAIINALQNFAPIQKKK